MPKLINNSFLIKNAFVISNMEPTSKKPLFKSHMKFNFVCTLRTEELIYLDLGQHDLIGLRYLISYIIY